MAPQNPKIPFEMILKILISEASISILNQEWKQHTLFDLINTNAEFNKRKVVFISQEFYGFLTSSD